MQHIRPTLSSCLFSQEIARLQSKLDDGTSMNATLHGMSLDSQWEFC